MQTSTDRATHIKKPLNVKECHSTGMNEVEKGNVDNHFAFTHTRAGNSQANDVKWISQKSRIMSGFVPLNLNCLPDLAALRFLKLLP